MNSVEEWWAKWKVFMFEKTLKIKGKSGEQELKPCEMLEKIKNSKYPAISVEEEAISIPLQTLCQAVFDAILVHMLNTVSPNTWHGIKVSMMDSLNNNKNGKLTKIMETSYEDFDVWFLQEVAAMFIEDLKKTALAKIYDFLVPEKLDGKRDQNSIILVRKGKFEGSSAVEVTAEISKNLSADAPVAAGDLYACTVVSQDKKYLLASFHGDTNGLATVPVLDAICTFHAQNADCQLLFGLDANTYKKHKEGKNQGVAEFADYFVSKKLNSIWGPKPDPESHTTFNGRTFLQPQLNKAAKKAEIESKGDKNPKDFILFEEV
eukprot:scaffold1973_cov399-Prasinococcus_capsulatus_cf.AAC.7